jgi:PleD family two-component response regulator
MRSFLTKLRGIVTLGQDILRKRTAIGSTKRVELPSATRYPPKRVLVADDNRTSRNVLAAILEAAGHIVVMVTDGDEALEEMKKGGIDILLIDVTCRDLTASTPVPYGVRLKADETICRLSA